MFFVAMSRLGAALLRGPPYSAAEDEDWGGFLREGVSILMRGGVWIARALSSSLGFGIGFFFFLIWIVFGLDLVKVLSGLVRKFFMFGFSEKLRGAVI